MLKLVLELYNAPKLNINAYIPNNLLTAFQYFQYFDF